MISRSTCRRLFFLPPLFAIVLIVAMKPGHAQNSPVMLPSPARTWTSPGHTRYYVDSVAGSDANDGKSASHAWQSLDKVNAGTFAAGDWILLKAGSHWSGFLAPGGSGEQRHPIKIDSYGTGPKPAIDSAGQALASVSIHNGEYWDIQNLDIANNAPSPIPMLRGVEVSLYDFGTAHGIYLHNLDVHDVTSSEDKDHGGSGIFCDNRGDKVQSRFDGLLIEDCHLVHTDRNGITMDSGYWDRTKWYPNLNVVIRDNLLTDIGGDCIVTIGCDGSLVEHNTVHGGRMRATDWASGIWSWSCDNAVMQFNEISGMHGQMDAQGFDSDWNCRYTVIQYNYSHDNQGGFVMMCNNGDVKAPRNIGNIGSIVRYNISQNDGYRSITLSGPVQDEQIYNNDIYIGKDDNAILIFSWNWGGDWPKNTHLTNNIFDIAGKAHDEFGGMQGTVLDSNVFWGNMDILPDQTHLIKSDPMFQSPGSAGDGFDTVAGYQLNSNSPCLGAGALVAANGERDFWNKKVSDSKPPDVGAG